MRDAFFPSGQNSLIWWLLAFLSYLTSRFKFSAMSSMSGVCWVHSVAGARVFVVWGDEEIGGVGEVV